MKFTSNATVSRPRYRTIKECHEGLMKLDKDCKISIGFIRRLCKQNKIEYLANGSKSLVNYDKLLDYFGFSEPQEDKPKKAKPCIELGLIKCDKL